MLKVLSLNNWMESMGGRMNKETISLMIGSFKWHKVVLRMADSFLWKSSFLCVHSLSSFRHYFDSRKNRKKQCPETIQQWLKHDKKRRIRSSGFNESGKWLNADP